jgi:N-acetylglucosaminyldiphosphoundecaprenol N-acetyl-beta-D-mannosaminyltransferase
MPTQNPKLRAQNSKLKTQNSKLKINILGVAIDNIVEDEAVAFVEQRLTTDQPCHIVTVNPEFIMEARRNPAFAAVLKRADLATPDGFGLILAARYLRQPLRGRVTGVELSQRIAELAAAQGYRLFLLGAAEGVAAEAAAVLKARYPGLIIAGTFAGTPQPQHEPFLQQLIAASRSDILLVAYGHPAQDLWIARNQAATGATVAMGVGGVFDFLAGRVPRAPQLLRRLGLEWLYRLAIQPWRWRRIIDAVPRFAWEVVMS